MIRVGREGRELNEMTMDTNLVGVYLQIRIFKNDVQSKKTNCNTTSHQAVSQVQIFGLSLACHHVRVAVWAKYDQKLRSAKS